MYSLMWVYLDIIYVGYCHVISDNMDIMHLEQIYGTIVELSNLDMNKSANYIP